MTLAQTTVHKNLEKVSMYNFKKLHQKGYNQHFKNNSLKIATLHFDIYLCISKFSSTLISVHPKYAYR